MKKLLFLIGFTVLLSSVESQISYQGMFHLEDSNGPEIFADGILAYFVQSDNQLKFCNPEQALLILDSAIAQNPFFVESYIKRARIYQLLGRTESAQKDLATARRLNIDYPVYLDPGSVNHELSHLTNVDRQYRQFYQSPVHSSQNQLMEKAIKLKLQGQPALAMNYANQLFSQENSPAARDYNLRGNLHLMLQDHYNAIKDYSKAIQLAPNEPLFYYNRGVAQIQTINRIAGCEDLEKSQQLGFQPSTKKLSLYCYH